MDGNSPNGLGGCPDVTAQSESGHRHSFRVSCGRSLPTRARLWSGRGDGLHDGRHAGVVGESSPNAVLRCCRPLEWPFGCVLSASATEVC